MNSLLPQIFSCHTQYMCFIQYIIISACLDPDSPLAGPQESAGRGCSLIQASVGWLGPPASMPLAWSAFSTCAQLSGVLLALLRLQEPD